MVAPGTPVDALETPCLLVDLARVEDNIRRWQDAVDRCGVALRPHVKTHKCPELAAWQLRAGARGITVAKVGEAEVFAAQGCADVFVAYPVIGQGKLARLAALARSGRVTAGVDSPEGVRGLAAAAAAAGVTLGVRVEVDLGMHRSGVSAREDVAGLCREVLACPGLDLDGIFTFRSTLFAGAAGRSAEELGREEGEAMVTLATWLRSQGIPVRQVSLGSTPTALAAARVPGVTEVRPGTYIFGDWAMLARGAVTEKQLALSVLCTVVSRPGPDTATVDGGSKTFCGDMSPAKVGVPGYARAVDVDAHVETMSEEHGVVRLGPGVQPRVGDRLAFHPLHVCTAVNLADELLGIRNGRVEQVLPVSARGRTA